MADQPAPDVGGRLLQYRRRVNLISWIGAGLIAEISVYAAVVQDGRANFYGLAYYLWAVVPTFVLIAGLSLSKARVHFEWLADLLQRHIDGGTLSKTDLMSRVAGSVGVPADWPFREAEIYYLLELIGTLLGGICLLALIWWPQLPEAVKETEQSIEQLENSFSKMAADLNANIRDAMKDAESRLESLESSIRSEIVVALEDDERASRELQQTVTDTCARPAPECARTGTYILQPGDTLATVAARLGKPVDELAKTNNISNKNMVYVGDHLKY